MSANDTDTFREPTDYEVAILAGLQNKPHIYGGYGDDQFILRADGEAEFVPDPRIARTERRRAKNRVARASRRINRIRSKR
ncbi:hypothetical protein [Gordonia soli]|uniref:Uncharacterized protein n=1 Tax=Gordonia soli NBRC 108243 TaxID=1223545 RepID=M0QS99_9ACTN|nr:hypothetical protein [Gordonia soli]GAC71077.1 hypothetical protein GS4_51_00150 [Gordonia soli NBRC 108243]